MRPKIENYYWSRKLAYAVGLIATDGNLSIDGRHIELTSKDVEQLKNFCNCLNKQVKIGQKISGYTGTYHSHVQIGDITLYKFLLKIGLTPKKSKTIGELKIPNRYFVDFLRGCLDGDGCTYSYWDPRWRSSFMLYTTFTSASSSHVLWLQGKIEELYGIIGKVSFDNRSNYNLRFAKTASTTLLGKIYYKKNLICLTRKRLKVEASLGIINNDAAVLEQADRPA